MKLVLCTTVVALCVSLAAAAADTDRQPALTVKVLPDRYVAAGRSFTDLAALEAWASPVQARSLSLDACGPASSSQLFAAVERFQSTYSEAVRVRALPLSEPVCFGSDHEYLATDFSGRSTLP